MLKSLLLLFLTFTSLVYNNIISQEKKEITVKLTDDRIKTIQYDDYPEGLSPWEIRISPMGVGGMPLLFLGHRLQGVYTIDEKIELDVTFTIANPVLEMLRPSYPRDKVIASDSRFMLHYTFNKKLKSDKVKNVPVDYSAHSHYYTKVHTVSLPIQSAVNLRATSGVGYSGSNVQFKYNFEDEDKNNLVAGPMRSLEVYAGVSRLKTKNFSIHLDHFSKSNFSKNEFYFLLTLSPYVNYTVYEVNEGGAFSKSYTQINRKEIDNYRRSPLGFRLGYNGTFAIWKGTAVILGFETGKMSTIFSHNNIEHRSNMQNNIFIPLYAAFNFGLSFGANTWK